jgi:hypothetical protein
MSTVNVKDSNRGTAMKSRDRQPSGAGAQAAASPAREESANGAQAFSGGFLWEDWYRQASPSQQAELLALAGQQGFLYAQQIPAHSNGEKPTVEENPGLSILTDLLAGRLQQLSPILANPLEIIDTQLDPLQRQAVARALATPDVCLIQGLPGSGKSRVVAEIIAQAARQGLRILFLGQHASSVDKVLEKLTKHEEVFPIRLTTPDEVVATSLQPLLLSQRMQSFRTQALEKAKQGREKVEDQCRRRQKEEEHWPSLLTLIEQHQQIEERLQSLRHQVEQVPVEVQKQAAEGNLNGAFQELVRANEQELSSWEKSVHEVDGELLKAQEPLNSLQNELSALEPYFQAKKANQWWTLAWWKATFQGKFLARKTELEKLYQVAQENLANLQQKKAALEKSRQDMDQQFQVKRAHLLHEEISQRQQNLHNEQLNLQASLPGMSEHWQTLVNGLEPAFRPAKLCPQALESTRRVWQSQKQKDEKHCQFAQQWVKFLEDAGERLAARLPALANVVAGTTAAWQQEKDAFPGLFDVLLLEEAEHLPEANLLPLAQKARRWVLVGNYLTPPTVTLGAPANPRNLRATPPKVGAFQKLWNLLHGDPSKLPYTWALENGKLLCQLRPVAAQDRDRLENESLADAPDIELRILTLPRSEPVLAQVAFPATTPLDQAKAFIYRELQELALQTPGRNAWLEEQPDKFLFHLMPAPTDQATAVNLEPGLCEWMAQGQTYQLEYARNKWNQAQVLGWIERHLRLRDWGRTMFLQIPHRMEDNLARWVGDVLFPGTLLPSPHRNDLDHPVAEFVSVPDFSKGSMGKGENRNKKLPSDGSGLEIDLTGSRFADRIPGELMAGLPRQGFANFLEAQAVVRKLEKLVKDAPAEKCFSVMAFYSGQVELIRRLVTQSPVLKPYNIEVGLPGHFRDRECSVLVVSLTRSNFHRTGLFAPESADPFLAMTRAQYQLILVGDPGTLIRWSQSQEPAESLETGRERLWVRQLARYLQGKGSYQSAFYLCEGSS